MWWLFALLVIVGTSDAHNDDGSAVLSKFLDGVDLQDDHPGINDVQDQQQARHKISPFYSKLCLAGHACQYASTFWMEAIQKDKTANPTSVDIEFKVNQCAGGGDGEHSWYQLVVTAGYLPAAGQSNAEREERVAAAKQKKHQTATYDHEVNEEKSKGEGEAEVVGELEVREQATGARCPDEATFSCVGRCAPGYRCCNKYGGRCVKNGVLCDKPPAKGKDTCGKGFNWCKTCGHRCLSPSETCPQVASTGEFTKHPFEFALSKSDGSFVKGYCHVDDKEDFCTLKKLIVQQAVRKVKAAKTVPLSGATDELQYADHTFETSGIHPQNGKYQTRHEQRVRSDGNLEMIETTTHEAQTINDNAGGDGLEGDGTETKDEDLNGSLKSKLTVTTKTIVNKNDFSIQVLDDHEEVRLGALDEETTLLQEGDEERNNVIGSTLIKERFELEQQGSPVASAGEQCTKGGSFFVQVDLEKRVHLVDNNHNAKDVDVKMLQNSLAAEGHGIGKLIHHLNSRPKALDSADRTVMNWLQTSTITHEQFGTYLGALAAVNNTPAEDRLMRHLTNPAFVLNLNMTDALNNGLVALLVRPKRSEKTIGSMLRLSRQSDAPDFLRHQALLILGALLHPYRHPKASKPDHVQKSFDALLRHLHGNATDPQLVATISALGNARWPSSEQHVSRFVSSLDSQTSDAAVDALGRLPSLSLQTRQQLHQLGSSDTWQNHASQRTKNALTALLQANPPAEGCTPEKMAGNDWGSYATVHGTYAEGAYANLDPDPTGIDGAKGFNCQSTWSGSNTLKVPLFNVYKVISESDVHTTTVRGVAALEGSNGGPVTPKTVKGSATASLEAKIYGRKLTPISTGLEKKVCTRDQCDESDSTPFIFFIDVLGFRVLPKSSPHLQAPTWQDSAGSLMSSSIAHLKKLISTKAAASASQTANNVCGGKFDFTWTGSKEMSLSKREGALTLTASHTQSFLSFHRVVCFAWVCVDVFFDLSGTVSVQPGFYWNRCDSASGPADTYVFGFKPAAKLVLSLELGGTTGFARAGAGGSLTLFQAALPMYGRHNTKSGTCGSLDLSAGMFSGSLYLYLDFFNPFVLSWERAGQWTFLTWKAPALSMQLRSSCKSGSRCTWNWQTPFNLQSRKYPNECMYPKGGNPGKNKEVFFKGAGCNKDKKFTLEAIAAGDGAFYLKSSKTGYCLHPRASSGLENAAIDLLDEQDGMEENAQCKKDTEASCGWLDCADWRNAECKGRGGLLGGGGKCMCGTNKCAEWTKHAGGVGVHDYVCKDQPVTLAPSPAPPPAQPQKGTYVVFQAGCTEELSAIKFVKIDKGNGWFILKSKKTGMCVHPQHRQDKTGISGWILSSNCAGTQLQLKEVPHEERRYGYCTGKYDTPSGKPWSCASC
jgi:hypothetical protein